MKYEFKNNFPCSDSGSLNNLSPVPWSATPQSCIIYAHLHYSHCCILWCKGHHFFCWDYLTNCDFYIIAVFSKFINFTFFNIIDTILNCYFLKENSFFLKCVCIWIWSVFPSYICLSKPITDVSCPEERLI